MTLKILRTKKEYLDALKRFEEIFQAKTGTPESDEAGVLELLIRQYEDRHYVIQAPSPLEAIRYRMEQQGLTNKDLVVLLGYKSRVTDMLAQKQETNPGHDPKIAPTLSHPARNPDTGILIFYLSVTKFVG
jgi:HTH-type transcriptional regulator/antitoxin HigA